MPSWRKWACWWKYGIFGRMPAPNGYVVYFIVPGKNICVEFA